MKFIYLIILLFSIAGVMSCDTTPIEPTINDFGADYFPLKTGNYVSYNVKETIYELSKPSQTITYQLREVVGEQYQDVTYGTSYLIERWRRENGLQNWQLIGMSTARKNNQLGIRTENNATYIKFMFPLEEGKKWNANVYNDNSPENYQLRDIGKTYTFSGKKYSETATVLQSKDSSAVDKDIRIEVYAKAIGLIYKKSDIVIYCQDEKLKCFGKGIIERGNVVEQSIFDYGVK